MKREPPTEREIADLIASVFEGLPAPDPRRLAAIEQRLLAETGSRGRSRFAWWWLFAALATGAASALWWAVDYDSNDGRIEPVPGFTAPPATPLVDQPARTDRPESRESTPASKPVQKQGPVIYQRER
jgi:hypothetical protein